MSLWDIIVGRKPENENDFSVPRNNVFHALSAFLNPMQWLQHSNLFSNILCSPMISSVLLMGRMNGGNMNGFGNMIQNDLEFMANELDFYQNNSVLMYSSALSYFQQKCK